MGGGGEGKKVLHLTQLCIYIYIYMLGPFATGVHNQCMCDI